MADVLLVHVREDETLADSIGISLERSGLTVARGESVFDVGDEVPCVVVLWSDVSTRSSMVRDVAIRAQREGKLVAATLGGCETPLGFSRPSPYDLSEWGGDPDDPTLDAVFFAADRLVCAAKLSPPAPRARTPQQPYAQRPMTQSTSARNEGAEEDYEQRRDARREMRDLPATPLPRMTQPAPDAGGDLPPNLAAETLAWKQIEHSKNPQDFLDYLTHYGAKGIFSELATMKLDKLTPGSKAPAKGSFMSHRAAPHLDKNRRPAPKAAPPRAESRPAPRAEARPAPRPEPRGEQPRPQASERRPEPRLSEIRRPESDLAPPRTGVATAARRRPAAPVQIRHAAPAEGGGFPWRPILFLVVLGAGGFAVYQNLPKMTSHQTASSFADALRAAPADDSLPPDQNGSQLAATSMSDAALDPTEAGKRTNQKFADARTKKNEGVGGPVLSMMPRNDSGGGAVPRTTTPAPRATTPAPIVNFRPIEPTNTAPTAPATTDTSPAYDPTPPAANRYVQAHWVLQPSATKLGSYYPEAAQGAGIPGIAQLDCSILQSGRLDCVVQSETPTGQGFGAAAVKASRAYLASPQAADGSMAYGARTRLTIAFR